MSKVSLPNLSMPELITLLGELGEPSFRAKQVARWLHRRLASSCDQMTDLPVPLRQRLAEVAQVRTIQPISQVSSADGATRKELFGLADGQTVETVLMLYPGRRTVCVSSQAGCAVGCPFCATGQGGYRRNLTAGEMVEQVLHFAAEAPVTNVVFMGMGEPLANYEATLKAVRILNAPDLFGLGARHVTISTAGLVPRIRRLAAEPLQVGLAVSLHAPTNELRDELVPLNKKYPLEELIAACRDYFAATGRRITFEYALFDGINCFRRQARELADLLRELPCHVNLIPANLTADARFQPPPVGIRHAFQAELTRLGVNCTLREGRGQDIAAGCGQLRGRYEAKRVAP